MVRVKVKRVVIAAISIIAVLVVLVIVLISPITKYLVEKYDEKYTGRQIKLDWIYLNPFTGYIHCSNLKIYELKSDSVFFAADGLSVNFAIGKLFSKTYEISELVLNQPKGIIIQKGNKHDLNFNDLIEKFSSKETDTVKSPVHFSILNIKVNDGEFYYRENVIPVYYFIEKVNVESSGLRWDSDTIAGKFSFFSGVGKGDMKGDFCINKENLNYRLNTIIHEYDLSFMQQYLKDISNYGSFKANLDANVKAKGNVKEARNLEAKGELTISDFHFGKNSTEDYASFNKFTMGIIELNPKNHKYLFDSVLLSHPFFKYEKYDHLDNIQTMFGKGGANVRAVHSNPEHFNLILEIADYVKELAKNFFESYYKVKRLEIVKGDMKFNDYSLNEKFSIAANPLFVEADSIDKSEKRVKLSFKTDLKPYGNAWVTLSINPHDSGDFDVHYHIKRLPVTMFNPYLIEFTSFPMDRGTMEFNGTWNVRNSIIQSDNHFLLIDPRIAKRIKKKDLKWVPLPLIMAFVRERGNVIDYEIPITGDLKNPKFHLRDVLLDLLTNIFVKPPTTPYGIEVKNVENEIEKSIALKWEMSQSSLMPKQEKFVRKLAHFLKENPEGDISVYPIEYFQKEKENIMFFEAKKKYFLLTNNKKTQSFNEEDSLRVVKMSVKDSLFVRYLNKHVGNKMIFTIQEKCSLFVGDERVTKRFDQLAKQRENIFMAYFKENGTNNKVKLHVKKNEVPYNGFSYFKIEYNGDIPRSLIKAYEDLNELDEEYPRKKYFWKRKSNEGKQNN